MKKSLTKLLMLLGVFLLLGAGSVSARDVYLIGTMNDWKTNDNFKFSGDDNKLTLTVTLSPNQYGGQNFKIKDNNQDNGVNENDKDVLDIGGSLTLVYGGNKQLWIPISKNNTQLTFTYYHEYSGAPRIEVTEVQTPSYPSTLYLYHTTGIDSWNMGNADATSNNNGVYTWTGITIPDAGNGLGYLTLSSVDDSDWNNVNKGRYGATTDGLKIANNGSQTINKNYNNSWSVDPGIYTVTVNLSTNKISVSKTGDIAPSNPTSIWVVGDGEGLSWSLPGKKIDANDDGSFSFHSDYLGSFKFSTVEANNWNTFNANSYATGDGTGFDEGVGNEGGQKRSIKKSKNDQNLPWIGSYSVIISKDLSEMTVYTATPNPDANTSTVYFKGWINDWQAQNIYKFETEDDDLYTLIIVANEGGTKDFKIWDDTGNDGTWYGKNVTLNDGKSQDGLDIGGNDNNLKFNFTKNKSYKVTFWKSDKKIQVESFYPESMYLYGHIGKGSWEKNNKVELKKRSDIAEGYYVNDYVELVGRWNAKDNRLDSERGEGDPTGDYVYVAFYEEINTKIGFDNKGSGVWKFISNGDNSGDHSADNGHNYRVTYPSNSYDGTYSSPEGRNYSVLRQQEDEKNNYYVETGYYKVEINLNELWVRFTRVPEQKERDYIWYFGDDANNRNADATLADYNEEENHYTHSFTYGNTDLNVVQVGCSGNPNHPAAKQADFIVKKKVITSSPNGSGVKRYAEDYVYVDATPTEDGVQGDYTLHGDNTYKNNTLIELHNAGEYQIIATLDHDRADLKDLQGYTINDATLYATVLPLAVESATNSDVSVPFNPQGSTTLPSVVYLNKNLTYGTDFTVTLSPVDIDNEEYWIKPTVSNNLNASYKAALTQGNFNQTTGTWSLFDQYVHLGESNVDGFWTQVGTVTATKSETQDTEGWYAYDVQALVPCSGLYTLTVNPVGTSNFEVKTNDVEVEIYPNLFATFGTESNGGEKDWGFNLDGYTFNTVTEDTGIINFPIDSYKDDAIQYTKGFIPGTYFVNSLTTSAPSPVKPSTKKLAAGDVPGDTAPYYVDINATNTDFTVYVAKNGASHDFKFQIKNASTGFQGSTTGVDAIGAEADGEAVYYNLQGVKVQNPEKGIYVKVQNGQATKVVL